MIRIAGAGRRSSLFRHSALLLTKTLPIRRWTVVCPRAPSLCTYPDYPRFTFAGLHYLIASYAIAYPGRRQPYPQPIGHIGISRQRSCEARRIRHRIVIGWFPYLEYPWRSRSESAASPWSRPPAGAHRIPECLSYLHRRRRRLRYRNRLAGPGGAPGTGRPAPGAEAPEPCDPYLLAICRSLAPVDSQDRVQDPTRSVELTHTM